MEVRRRGVAIVCYFFVVVNGVQSAHIDFLNDSANKNVIALINLEE